MGRSSSWFAFRCAPGVPVQAWPAFVKYSIYDSTTGRGVLETKVPCTAKSLRNFDLLEIRPSKLPASLPVAHADYTEYKCPVADAISQIDSCMARGILERPIFGIYDILSDINDELQLQQRLDIFETLLEQTTNVAWNVRFAGRDVHRILSGGKPTRVSKFTPTFPLVAVDCDEAAFDDEGLTIDPRAFY